jgi:tetratricopeptide (TPR) repeat protein
VDVRVRAERLLASLLWKDGRHADAIAPLERAVALEPASIELLTELADARIAAGRLEAAGEACRAALAIDPTRAELWVRLGKVHADLLRPGAALEAYKRAVALDPGLHRVHNEIGTLLAARGERAAAARAFESALRVRPDYAAARANLDRLRGEPAIFP